VQHTNLRMSIVDAGWTYAWPQDWSVAPASPGPFARALEHRESTEAARPEAGGEPAEAPAHVGEPFDGDWCGALRVDCLRCRMRADGRLAAPEVSPVEPTAPLDVPERREHELLRIDGIPADSYPFLPTDRVVDVHARRCRHCSSSSALVRLHFDAGWEPGNTLFAEYLCSSCA
jgi:hypothetical protein